jgi:hypothetical protein
MTTDNYLVSARDREQQKFRKILAGAVGGSLLLHLIAAVIFNSLPKPALDNVVEVTVVDSSELPPEFQSSPSPTPSVKISLTATPPPRSKVTPSPTPSVKITPTPTPSVKIKTTPTPTPLEKNRIPVPVKIVTELNRPQPIQTQQTTEPISKPSGTASPSLIATNPSPVAQPNENKIEKNSPDSQPTGGNRNPGVTEKPITPFRPSAIDPNSSSLVNPGQPELTNPNPPESPFDISGSGAGGGVTFTVIPGGLDDLMTPGDGTNPNSKLPNSATPGKSGSGSSDNTRGNPGNNSPSRSNSQPLIGKENGNNTSGAEMSSRKNPGTISPSLPDSSPSAGSGGTSKQDIQKYFGELACLKNCKPVYPKAITEFKKVKVSIKLNDQGRVIPDTT